jgi:hypothetical protein
MDYDTLRKAREERLNFLELNVKSVPKLSLLDQPAPNTEELLRSGRFSDFTVKCGDFSFSVHKSVLWSQSDYFKTLTDGPFEESKKNLVTLDDTTPRAVAMLLLLIYIGNGGQYLDRVYDIWPALGPPAYEGTNETDKFTYLHVHFCDELKTLCEVYALADRLLVSYIADAVARYLTCQIKSVLFENFQPEMYGPGINSLTNLLKNIYDITSPDDVKLREETTMICLQNQNVLKRVPTAVEVIKQHDGRAWRCAKRSVDCIEEIYGSLLAFRFTGTTITREEFMRAMKARVWNSWGY